MSDLISRSAVIDYLREQAGLVIIEKNKKGFVNADVCNGMMCSIEAFRNFILLLPTVEAIPKEKLDEIVGQLEEQAEECRKYWNEFDDEDSFGGMNAYCDAIEIVKGVMNERD